MKKRICALLAAAVVIAACGSVYATDATVGSTLIRTSVEAKYEVNIPADTAIVYNTLSSPIGGITVTITRIDPNKQVVVKAQTDGRLINTLDNAKSIRYKLRSLEADFISAVFTASGTAPLTIDISASEWDAAAAGDYSDTITFTVSYSDIV